MVTRVDSPLRVLVERYLRDEMTFLDFEQQFVVASWDVEKRGNPDLIAAANEVVCLLVDVRDGRVTEDELRAALRAVAVTGGHSVASWKCS